MNKFWRVVDHEVKLNSGYVAERLSENAAIIRRTGNSVATRSLSVGDKAPLPAPGDNDNEIVVRCVCRRGRGGCRLHISPDQETLSCVPMTGSRCADCQPVVEES